MSSHLNNNPSSDYLYSTSFSPVEFKDLRKQNRLWQIGTIIVMIAWLVVAFYGFADALLMICSAILVIPLIVMATTAGKIRHDYRDEARRRSFVTSVNNFVREYDESGTVPAPRAQLVFAVARPYDDIRVKRVTVSDEMDPMRVMIFDVSPTQVGTIEGPNLERFFPALRQVLTSEDDFVKYVDKVHDSLHRVPVPIDDVSPRVTGLMPE